MPFRLTPTNSDYGRDAGIWNQETSLERLSLLNLHTLEQRRFFADLIMCYNIIKDNNCIDSSTFFTFSNNKFSRGHPLKLSIPLTKLNTRKYFSPIVSSQFGILCQTKLFGPFPSISFFKRLLHRTNLSKYLIFPSVHGPLLAVVTIINLCIVVFDYM